MKTRVVIAISVWKFYFLVNAKWVVFHFHATGAQNKTVGKFLHIINFKCKYQPLTDFYKSFTAGKRKRLSFSAKEHLAKLLSICRRKSQTFGKLQDIWNNNKMFLTFEFENILKTTEQHFSQFRPMISSFKNVNKNIKYWKSLLKKRFSDVLILTILQYYYHFIIVKDFNRISLKDLTNPHLVFLRNFW